MPGRLQDVRSFAVYYGTGAADSLSRFDMAVIDAGAQGSDGVHRIKSRGCLVLGYLSALEVPQQPCEGAPLWALRDARGPLVNSAFGNWIIDPRSAFAGARLFAEVRRAAALGCDGVFLDTLADVEDFPTAPGEATEIVTAAAGLVKSLADRVGCVIVQNRGFHRLLPMTASSLDGVCWEAFPYRRIGFMPRLHSGISALAKLRSRGLAVFALNEGVVGSADRARAAAAARRCGFPWYGTARYTDPPASQSLR